MTIETRQLIGRTIEHLNGRRLKAHTDYHDYYQGRIDFLRRCRDDGRTDDDVIACCNEWLRY